MKLVLADIDSSFATRERARQLVPAKLEGELVVDISRVFVSPSFLAELLTLAAATVPVKVIADADSAFNANLARKLVSQLGFDNVEVAQLAAA